MGRLCLSGIVFAIGILLNPILDPGLYLLQHDEGLQLLVALHRENDPSDFLDTPQNFEDIIIQFVIGRQFLSVEDDVVEHFLVRVVFFELIEGLQKGLLVLRTRGIPLTVEGKN